LSNRYFKNLESCYLSSYKDETTMIDKHLLFSALSTIIAKEENIEAQELTLALADFLRFSFQESRPIEPLGRELDALVTYIWLQKSHHEDNLVSRISCSEDSRGVPVVPMMIQPLLQNAFKYGLRTSEMPLRVEVTTHIEKSQNESEEGDFLVVRVSNSGRWVEPLAERPGKSLADLRNRLSSLIGERATLEVTEEFPWVHALIRIPVDAANQAFQHITKGSIPKAL
jgi:LytS/YehU family sensor histidine kinase